MYKKAKRHHVFFAFFTSNGTIFYLIPHFFPFFSPDKGPCTTKANFLRQIRFLDEFRCRDLGIGLSTLGKWLAAQEEADLLFVPHADVSRELSRLRKENEILCQESATC